jgi:endonuclease/exonuclease/phosphatase family metal-dependent hydrolase
MCLADSSRLDFIVNHHPSKYGGEKESEGRREAAMKALKELCDSLENEHVIAMGDFNDTPDAGSFEIIEGTLVNKGLQLHERGEGTIRYEGKWDLIDMFMVSPSLAGKTRMEVCRIPFLMTWEKKHPGEKPLRTYSGPRYIGGVSDHCPIVLKIGL